MEIQARADAIALIGVKNTLKKTLRQPPGLPVLSMAECVDQLTELLTTELETVQLARFAAIATVQANLHREAENNLHTAFSALSAAIQSNESPQQLKQMIAKLEKENPVAWVGVDLGQIISRKLKASDASKRSKQKSALVKAYALDLFDKGDWKSKSQARNSLWPKVQAEAKRVGWAITTTQGPETLYGWLLAHKK
jgi:hypothetical protein